jgi:hypothetical protein
MKVHWTNMMPLTYEGWRLHTLYEKDRLRWKEDSYSLGSDYTVKPGYKHLAYKHILANKHTKLGPELNCIGLKHIFGY